MPVPARLPLVAAERPLDPAPRPTAILSMARPGALKLIAGVGEVVEEPSMFLSTLIRRGSVMPPAGGLVTARQLARVSDTGYQRPGAGRRIREER